jgi:phospholipid/cholesterol/gamma-HCH transport system permease protein
MREQVEFAVEADDQGGSALVLTGALCVHSLGDIDRRIDAEAPAFSAIDLSRLSDIDTAGAWLALHLARTRGAQIRGANAKAQRLLKAVSATEDLDEAEVPDRPGPLIRVLERTGEAVIDSRHGLVRIVGFLGAMLISAGDVIRHPSRFRGRALIHQMELVGVNSLGIIGLMSFLIGIVIAQQGAVQLEQFGAEIYTINLTGRLSLRELGILMTAIMVAGRSGSAFAAQIGTMRLTEEVDAMRTIGVSPMEALVLPRVLAAMLMMPLLGFYASLIAIMGGAFISMMTLDIPFLTFVLRIQEVVPLHDIWVGLVKAPVFGLIIAVSGCYHGMQVKGSAEEVGLRTTEAVVAGIFMVIVLDAFFAVFFSKVGWG